LKVQRTLALLACTVALGACKRNDVVEDFGPETIYQRGSDAMNSSNYPVAVQAFQLLQARYPFSPLTRQAQLDLIHVYYISNQPEAAIDAAEAFERENPTHPRVDYALYMKGVIYFDEEPGLLERWFKVDMSTRPPKDTLKSFAAFQELIRRFPESRYVADARQRMVFLRNRLATYENHVARFYIERGAYIAAVQRCKYSLEHYPGAPQLQDTLAIMIEAYDALGMEDLAADARRVQRESFPTAAAAAN
jgi:outer membrane protein assembly factor BamD